MTFGPLFFTATVQVTLPPAFTVGLETVLVRLRSYWHGIQSMVIDPVAPGPEDVGEAVPAAPLTPVGTGAPDTGQVAATWLEPPPPPEPLVVPPSFTVAAPPPP